MQIPLPSKDDPLVSMGPCPEILLEDRTITFSPPYPRMAMTQNGRKPTILIFRSDERPGVSSDLPEAVVRQYENFNQRNIRQLRFVELELSGWRYLGKCKGEVYCSNKEGYGENQEYVHEHNPPYPDLYINGNGNCYAITGGRYTIDEWIED